MAPKHTQIRGLFVVGMHRSGTSATTRVLNLLGVPLRTREDAWSHTGGNERGHWESRSLMEFNERLLRELGARWNDIPPLDAPVCGWHGLAAHGTEARRVFRSAHPTLTWAWKDPRLCLLLPFWRTVLPEPHAIVLVLRDPLEIAASLQARNKLPLSAGLLQWERSLGHALLGCAGAPTYVLRYPDLLDNPVAVCADLVAFLKQLGMAVTEADDQIRAFLSSQLRHSRHNSTRSRLLTPSQRYLLATLDELGNVHPSFEPPITHNWNCPARIYSPTRDAQRADVNVLHFYSHSRNLTTTRLALADDRYPAGDRERWNLDNTQRLPRGVDGSSATSRITGSGGGFLVRTTANAAENLEMILPSPRGGVESYWRKYDAHDDSWSEPVVLGGAWGAAQSATLVQTNVACRQNLELVMRCGAKLAHYSRQPSPHLEWQGPAWMGDCAVANPSLIQGSEGRNGNLELVVPHASGGIAHYWRDNDDAGRPWVGPQIFAPELGRVDAVALIESTFLAEGRLEVIARKGLDLAHYWRPLQHPGPWKSPTFFFTGAVGIPGFIQGRDDSPASSEVLTPVKGGGMAHLVRDNSEAAGTWRLSAYIDPGGPTVDAVSLIQGRGTSHPAADLEVVALSGPDVRWYRCENGPFGRWSCRLV